MAVTITLYDHTVSNFVDGIFTDAHSYIINLYSAMTPDVTDTQKSEVDGGATQLSTNYGYTQDTKTLGSFAITLATTNDAKIDAADVTWTASGGAIGPATHAVVFNDTVANDPPVFYVAFGESKTADDGTDFKITWHADGIITFTYT